VHEPVDAVDHVVDIRVRADGRPVAPRLDRAPIGRLSHLAAHRSRRLLAAPGPGALRAVAVLEAGNPHLHAMVPSVRLQHALRIELLPPILVVRVCGHCLGLGHLRLAGLHVPVDADRRREEVARHAQLGCRVRHVNVDQHAVVHDLALGRVDESHPAHVRGQLVHLVERAVAQRQCRAAVRRLTQVQHTELVGRGRGKLVLLDIHSTPRTQ